MGRVENKVVVITGAGSGLGKADALRLSEEGAKLVLTDINEAEGRRTGEECKGEAIFFAQDVKDESSWPRLIETTIAAFGRLDVLVNNAGNSHIANIESASTDQWHDILRVHLDGTFFGCRSAIPEMTKSGGGSIICTASVAGLRYGAGPVAYSASKAGVINLVQHACQSLVGSGIRVNAICPGLTETGMTKPLYDHARAAGKEGRIGQLNPLQRGGLPEEIAATALFLASPASSYVDGQAIAVDGGLSTSHPVAPSTQLAAQSALDALKDD